MTHCKAWWCYCLSNDATCLSLQQLGECRNLYLIRRSITHDRRRIAEHKIENLTNRRSTAPPVTWRSTKCAPTSYLHDKNRKLRWRQWRLVGVIQHPEKGRLYKFTRTPGAPLVNLPNIWSSRVAADRQTTFQWTANNGMMIGEKCGD